MRHSSLLPAPEEQGAALAAIAEKLRQLIDDAREAQFEPEPFADSID